MNNVIDIHRRPLSSIVIDKDANTYLVVLVRDDVTLGTLAQALAHGGMVISNDSVTESLVIHRAPRSPI